MAGPQLLLQMTVQSINILLFAKVTSRLAEAHSSPRLLQLRSTGPYSWNAKPFKYKTFSALDHSSLWHSFQNNPSESGLRFARGHSKSQRIKLQCRSLSLLDTNSHLSFLNCANTSLVAMLGTSASLQSLRTRIERVEIEVWFQIVSVLSLINSYLKFIYFLLQI